MGGSKLEVRVCKIICSYTLELKVDVECTGVIKQRVKFVAGVDDVFEGFILVKSWPQRNFSMGLDLEQHSRTVSQ
jgi:hypothetical protein